MSEVVELSGNAVCQLLTPVLRGAEQQHRVALSHSLIAQAHYVVIIALQVKTHDHINALEREGISFKITCKLDNTTAFVLSE